MTSAASRDPVSGTAEGAGADRSPGALRDQIRLTIGEDLRRVDTLLQRHFRSDHPYLSDVLQYTARFRGKQIRPVVLLLCGQALQKAIDETMVVLAAVVEMIHTATLVHDDIIDGAATRRHLATVNMRWNQETGVLLGDYLFSRAFRLAASTGDARACELIGRATDLTCAGELHQAAVRLSRSRSERDYFRIIRGKTGQLFGLSCRLGARCAGAEERLQRQLELAGLELGMAFQIADDLLDLTGEPSITGKDHGNDLANHRFTLPLLRAFQFASPADCDQLEQVLTSSGPAGDLQKMKQYRADLLGHPAVQQGVESARDTSEQLIRRCRNRLHDLPESPAKQLLEQITLFAVSRIV